MAETDSDEFSGQTSKDQEQAFVKQLQGCGQDGVEGYALKLYCKCMGIASDAKAGGWYKKSNYWRCWERREFIVLTEQEAKILVYNHNLSCEMDRVL